MQCHISFISSHNANSCDYCDATNDGCSNWTNTSTSTTTASDFTPSTPTSSPTSSPSFPCRPYCPSSFSSSVLKSTAHGSTSGRNPSIICFSSKTPTG